MERSTGGEKGKGSGLISTVNATSLVSYKLPQNSSTDSSRPSSATGTLRSTMKVKLKLSQGNSKRSREGFQGRGADWEDPMLATASNTNGNILDERPKKKLRRATELEEYADEIEETTTSKDTTKTQSSPILITSPNTSGPSSSDSEMVDLDPPITRRSPIRIKAKRGVIQSEEEDKPSSPVKVKLKLKQKNMVQSSDVEMEEDEHVQQSGQSTARLDLLLPKYEKHSEKPVDDSNSSTHTIGLETKVKKIQLTKKEQETKFLDDLLDLKLSAPDLRDLRRQFGTDSTKAREFIMDKRGKERIHKNQSSHTVHRSLKRLPSHKDNTKDNTKDERKIVKDETKKITENSNHGSRTTKTILVLDDQEEEPEAVFSGAGSDSEESEYGEGRLSPEEVVQFFNTCTAEQLVEATACLLGQAKIIVSMQPFHSLSHLQTSIRKTKGLPNAIVDNFRLIHSSYVETDRILEICEKEGRELSKVMEVWKQSSHQANDTEDDGALRITDIAISNRNELEGYIGTQPTELAEGFVLKNYQMLGLNWLYLLYSRKTSCILADEMGLGKTAQVIALLTHLKSIGEKGPHLVIVPSSTLDNWLREFSRFSPSLVVESYYGSQGERAQRRSELKRSRDLDVVVTTYNIATGQPDDRKFLSKKMGFNACVFDEGHILKNNESKKYRELMQIRVVWRLLLTGTPLQNNLQELVSLLSFIMPHIFTAEASKNIRAIFKVPAEAQVNLLSRERISRAKAMMTPFVLRRKKAQVLTDLPQKFERVEYCELTQSQMRMYSDTMLRSKKTLLAASDIAKIADEEGGEELKQMIKTTRTGRKTTTTTSANVLMELRKAANHPMLFRKLYTDSKVREIAKSALMEADFMDQELDHIIEEFELYSDYELHRICGSYRMLQKYQLKKNEWMESGKIQILKTLIPQFKEKGDRILLFSQFTSVLDILEAVLDTLQIKYLKLTGQTNVSDRQGLVDMFTDDTSITCFLLSTRAGGLGLNLMAANTVIIYDQDFNPHNDRQAEDRAFRLGQTRDVTVIRLISRGTIEEDIFNIANAKLRLDESVSADSTERHSLVSDTQLKREKPELADCIGEGDQALMEKRMKTSLLKNLQAKFQAETEVGSVPNGISNEEVVKSKYFP